MANRCLSTSAMKSRSRGRSMLGGRRIASFSGRASRTRRAVRPSFFGVVKAFMANAGRERASLATPHDRRVARCRSIPRDGTRHPPAASPDTKASANATGSINIGSTSRNRPTPSIAANASTSMRFDVTLARGSPASARLPGATRHPGSEGVDE
ncbi:hypothetical protein DIPPA_10199 [Diplonema papillatum]|nr:hypothetical protein DIPPA_10199 [Diplonema papillatum]